MVQFKLTNTQFPLNKGGYAARNLKDLAADDSPEPDPRTMQPPPPRSAPFPSGDLERLLRKSLW